MTITSWWASRRYWRARRATTRLPQPWCISARRNNRRMATPVSRSRARSIALGLMLASPLGVSTSSAADFYQGKQIRLILGFPAGNDYDLGARLLVKYLVRYIPGQPTIIVQNLPQAASVAA